MPNYQRPLAGNPSISDTFRGHIDRRPTSAEPGIDYRCAIGTPVYAIESGVIEGLKVTRTAPGGLVIHLRLDDGNNARYLHLDKILVKKGQRVTRGQQIGTSGITGATGAHLHLTLWLGAIWGPNIVDFEKHVGPAGGVGIGGKEFPARVLYGEDHVKRVQARLREMGHDLGPSGIDGYDGPRTQEIVRFEQGKAAQNGYPGGALAQDGVAGPSTWGYLDWWWNTGRHPKPAAPSYPVVDIHNIATIGDVRGLQKIAKVTVDNDWGKNSKAGFQSWLNANYGGSIVTWLTKRWGYRGDNRLGPVMIALLRQVNAANIATK